MWRDYFVNKLPAILLWSIPFIVPVQLCARKFLRTNWILFNLWREEEAHEDEEYQHFTFKLLGSQIAFTGNDGWFEEMRGIRLQETKE